MSENKGLLRLEKIISTFNREVHETFPKMQDQIYEYYEKNKQAMIQNFINSITNIIEQFKEDEEKINYLDISFLFSSYLSRDYVFKITGYNSYYYVDTLDRSSLFTYKEIMQEHEEDYNKIISAIKREDTLIKEYEIYELNLNFSILYFACLQNILIDLFENKQVMEYFKLNGEFFYPHVYIKYGSYMDQNSRIIKELAF